MNQNWSIFITSSNALGYGNFVTCEFGNWWPIDEIFEEKKLYMNELIYIDDQNSWHNSE